MRGKVQIITLTLLTTIIVSFSSPIRDSTNLVTPVTEYSILSEEDPPTVPLIPISL